MIVEQQCWDLCIKHNNIAPGYEILKIETIAMPFLSRMKLFSRRVLYLELHITTMNYVSRRISVGFSNSSYRDFPSCEENRQQRSLSLEIKHAKQKSKHLP